MSDSIQEPIIGDKSSFAWSAGLAKRLAEAADSLRDGEEYYFLSKLEFPFGLIARKKDGTHNAFNAAEIELAQLNAAVTDQKFYRIYGPFQTDNNGHHEGDHDEVELVFKKRNALSGNSDVTTSFTIDSCIDALVLNISAFDKFFLPYYTRLYGAEIALKLRKAADDEFKAGIIHNAHDCQRNPTLNSVKVDQ